MEEVVKKLNEALMKSMALSDPAMNGQQLMILLEVGKCSGLTQKQLALQTGMSTGAISRHISVMSKRERRNKDGDIELIGLGLLETRTDDPDDIRKKHVYLTIEGEEVVDQIDKIFTS